MAAETAVGGTAVGQGVSVATAVAVGLVVAVAVGTAVAVSVGGLVVGEAVGVGTAVWVIVGTIVVGCAVSVGKAAAGVGRADVQLASKGIKTKKKITGITFLAAMFMIMILLADHFIIE